MVNIVSQLTLFYIKSTLGKLDTEKLPNAPKLPHTQNSEPEHGSLRRALIVRNQIPALDDKSKQPCAPHTLVNVK